MATYATIESFKSDHPDQVDAMQFVFISPAGEIQQYIVHCGDWHNEVKSLMTSYVFINGWKSHIQTVRV